MPLRLAAIAALVSLLWSGNFVLIQMALDAHMAPLLLTAARFALASLLVFFTPRPTGIGWRGIAAVGLVLGVGQFGLASLAMKAGLPPGTTALVLQTQALFTIGLATAFLGERPTSRMIGGAIVALCGVAGLLGADVPSRVGLMLAVGAAIAAAGINILIKRTAPSVDPIRLAVWISPFPVLPLLALSCVFEASPVSILRSADISIVGPAVIYGGLVSTVLATALWTRLLRQAPASAAAPFALLVPVFGTILSAVVTGELPAPSTVLPFCVVLAGLAMAQGWLGRRAPIASLSHCRVGR
jgi:O-acetylserine/cysteine efflux transporter